MKRLLQPFLAINVLLGSTSLEATEFFGRALTFLKAPSVVAGCVGSAVLYTMFYRSNRHNFEQIRERCQSEERARYGSIACNDKSKFNKTANLDQQKVVIGVLKPDAQKLIMQICQRRGKAPAWVNYIHYGHDYGLDCYVSPSTDEYGIEIGKGFGVAYGDHERTPSDKKLFEFLLCHEYTHYEKMHLPKIWFSLSMAPIVTSIVWRSCRTMRRGVLVSSFATVAGLMSAILLTTKISRLQELEADLGASDDPEVLRRAVEFFRNFQEFMDPPLPLLLSTHPKTSQRIRNLEKRIAELELKKRELAAENAYA